MGAGLIVRAARNHRLSTEVPVCCICRKSAAKFPVMVVAARLGGQAFRGDSGHPPFCAPWVCSKNPAPPWLLLPNSSKTGSVRTKREHLGPLPSSFKGNAPGCQTARLRRRTNDRRGRPNKFTTETRRTKRLMSLRAKRSNLPPICARRRGIASSLRSSQ